METLIATYAFAATVVVGYASCLIVASRRSTRRMRELQARLAHDAQNIKSRRVA